jgi:hypothetical protein
MYEFIKTQIAADYFQHRFPNDGQRFVAWYLRNILFRDMNETRDDITDGGNDKQIDAIVIDDDKSLVRVIQGKFSQGGSIDAEPLREVLSAWIQIKDLARLQNVANQKLQRKLVELSAALEEDYEVSFELITTGKLTEAALRDLEAFQQELAKLSENENFDATIHVVDGDELKVRYDYAIEADNPSINYTLSPQNWVKTKGCLSGINGAIRNYFSMLPMMPGGPEIRTKLSTATRLQPEDFEYRWSAD